MLSSLLLSSLLLSLSASSETSALDVGMSAAAAHSDDEERVPFSLSLSLISIALSFAVAAAFQSFPARDDFIFDAQSEWIMLSLLSSSALLLVALNTCCLAVSHVGAQRVHLLVICNYATTIVHCIMEWKTHVNSVIVHVTLLPCDRRSCGEGKNANRREDKVYMQSVPES